MTVYGWAGGHDDGMFHESGLTGAGRRPDNHPTQRATDANQENRTMSRCLRTAGVCVLLPVELPAMTHAQLPNTILCGDDDGDCPAGIWHVKSGARV